MTLRHLNALLLALFLTTAARADPLSELLTRADTPLAFDLLLGAYDDSGLLLGQLNIRLQPDDADPTTPYIATHHTRLRLGALLVDATSTLHLGPRLDVRSDDFRFTYTARDDPAASTTTSGQRARTGDDTWREDRTTPRGETRTRTLSADHPDHSDLATQIVLGRLLVLHAEPGHTLPLHALTWPGDEPPRYDDLTLTLQASRTHEHRGQALDAHDVLITHGGDRTLTLTYTPRGTLLAFRDSDMPFHFIAGTEDEVTRDLPGNAPAPSATSPEEAVMIYFAVLSGQRPLDALDGIFDWTALRDDIGGDATLSERAVAETYKASFRRAFRSGFPITAEQARAVKLAVHLDGDAARVVTNGKEDSPFRLEKHGEHWLITHFPQ